MVLFLAFPADVLFRGECSTSVNLSSRNLSLTSTLTVVRRLNGGGVQANSIVMVDTSGGGGCGVRTLPGFSGT